VYDGPTVNSRDIADAYRAGQIAPPPAAMPTAPIAPATPYPAAMPAHPPAPPAPTPEMVEDGNTVKMRVEWPTATPTQGRLPSAPHPAPSTTYPASRAGTPYAAPSAGTPPLTVGPGSSLLSRELPSQNSRDRRPDRRSDRARRGSGAAESIEPLSTLENGLPPIAIACGVLMLLSLFLPWAQQTRTGAGVAFLPLLNRVESGTVHYLLLLPALAALVPLVAAFLPRHPRLLALVGGGGAGLLLSTLLLFMKPGAAKGLAFGGTGLFVYVLGALAALGIGLWVRGSGNRD
jgi:hypothetical protein